MVLFFDRYVYVSHLELLDANGYNWIGNLGDVDCDDGFHEGQYQAAADNLGNVGILAGACEGGDVENSDLTSCQNRCGGAVRGSAAAAAAAAGEEAQPQRRLLGEKQHNCDNKSLLLLVLLMLMLPLLCKLSFCLRRRNYTRQAPNGCFCDEDCQTNGDCCEDFLDYCARCSKDCPAGR